MCPDSCDDEENDVGCGDEQGNPEHLGGVLLAAMDVHVHCTSLNQRTAINSNQHSAVSTQSKPEGCRGVASNIEEDGCGVAAEC